MILDVFDSQGSTYEEPIVLDIGSKDTSCGLTYVALSRATNSFNIFHIGYARSRLVANFRCIRGNARVSARARSCVHVCVCVCVCVCVLRVGACVCAFAST